jgi:hypothetical protein
MTPRQSSAVLKLWEEGVEEVRRVKRRSEGRYDCKPGKSGESGAEGEGEEVETVVMSEDWIWPRWVEVFKGTKVGVEFTEVRIDRI